MKHSNSQNNSQQKIPANKQQLTANEQQPKKYFNNS
jgi:hypothetical protein